MTFVPDVETADTGHLPEACGPGEHCITCGDIAVRMHVLEVAANDGLGWCSETADPRSPAEIEVVDLGLLGDVSRGDVVLVHAGTALTQLAAAEWETGYEVRR